jgi:hypothetical protein
MPIRLCSPNVLGLFPGIQSALSGLDSVGKIDTSRISSLADQMADPNNLAYSTARALTRGDYNLSTDGYTGLLNGLSGQTQTEKSLQDAADGKFLGGANPYLDAVIGRSQGEAASKIAQLLGAAGRTGSGRYAATIADSLSGIATQARYTDYDNERTRQAQAATAIDSSRNARTSLQPSSAPPVPSRPRLPCRSRSPASRGPRRIAPPSG